MRIILIAALSLITFSGFAQKADASGTSNCIRHYSDTNLPELLKVSKSHAARQSLIDVTFYHLDLNIEVSTNFISGNVLVRTKAKHGNLDTVSLELHPNLTIDSVQVALYGEQWQRGLVQRNQNELNIVLPFDADSGQEIDTRIFYRGTPPVSGSFPTSGFFAGNGHKFSASPPYNAYTWYPCKQDLNDKADSSWFYITSSDGLKTVSNGMLKRIVDLPNQKKRWEWKSAYPIDFYLIAFVVGNFNQQDFYWKPLGRTDSMLISHYNYNKTNTGDILQVFSDKFGLYPFYTEKLAMVSVDLGGGIENQTMIGMGPGTPEAHEIMHLWFGDHVTTSSWRDVALNEGFAEWGISVWDEFKTGVSDPAARINRCNTYEANALTNANSVYGWNMDTTSVTGVFMAKNLYYDKAAMIINTLRFEVNNDEVFFEALRNYQNRFGGKNATVQGLKSVFEEATENDFTEFFDDWYYGAGYPKFGVNWNQSDGNLFLQITETTNAPSNPLIKTSLEIGIQRNEGDTLVRVFIDKNISSFKIPVSGSVNGLVVDPNQWVLNGKGTVARDETLAVGSSPMLPDWVAVPNPSMGQLTLLSNDNQKKSMLLVVSDLSGRVVLSKTVRLNEPFILDELVTGIYLLKTQDGRVSRLIVAGN